MDEYDKLVKLSGLFAPDSASDLAKKTNFYKTEYKLKIEKYQSLINIFNIIAKISEEKYDKYIPTVHDIPSDKKYYIGNFINLFKEIYETRDINKIIHSAKYIQQICENQIQYIKKKNVNKIFMDKIDLSNHGYFFNIYFTIENVAQIPYIQTEYENMIAFSNVFIDYKYPNNLYVRELSVRNHINKSVMHTFVKPYINLDYHDELLTSRLENQYSCSPNNHTTVINYLSDVLFIQTVKINNVPSHINMGNYCIMEGENEWWYSICKIDELNCDPENYSPSGYNIVHYNAQETNCGAGCYLFMYKRIKKVTK
jgi:hypothetical protein